MSKEIYIFIKINLKTLNNSLHIFLIKNNKTCNTKEKLLCVEIFKNRIFTEALKVDNKLCRIITGVEFISFQNCDFYVHEILT